MKCRYDYMLVIWRELWIKLCLFVLCCINFNTINFGLREIHIEGVFLWTSWFWQDFKFGFGSRVVKHGSTRLGLDEPRDKFVLVWIDSYSK